MTSDAKYLIAIIVGLAYVWFAVAFWDWYVTNNPINDFLLEVFARQGHEVLYWMGIVAHDAFVNVLLAVPAAFVLASINGLNNWNCVFAAVFAAFVGTYWTVDMGSLPLLINSWGFWAGLCMLVFSLPIAYVAAKMFRGQVVPK